MKSHTSWIGLIFKLVSVLFDATSQIRESVKFAQLVEFCKVLWNWPRCRDKADNPLLGIREGRAIFLLYNGIFSGQTLPGRHVLTGPAFDVLPTFNGPQIMNAAANRIAAHAKLRRRTFKKTVCAVIVWAYSCQRLFEPKIYQEQVVCSIER